MEDELLGNNYVSTRKLIARWVSRDMSGEERQKLRKRRRLEIERAEREIQRAERKAAIQEWKKVHREKMKEIGAEVTLPERLPLPVVGDGEDLLTVCSACGDPATAAYEQRILCSECALELMSGVIRVSNINFFGGRKIRNLWGETSPGYDDCIRAMEMDR